jgi:hypothetical protein
MSFICCDIFMSRTFPFIRIWNHQDVLFTFKHDNAFVTGLLPRPDGEEWEKPLSLPKLKGDKWTKKKALFGQNDYIGKCE